MRRKMTLLKELLQVREYELIEILYYDPKACTGEIPLIKVLLGSMCPLSPVMINYDRLSTPERCMVEGMLLTNHI
jgi:hypothetical protein